MWNSPKTGHSHLCPRPAPPQSQPGRTLASAPAPAAAALRTCPAHSPPTLTRLWPRNSTWQQTRNWHRTQHNAVCVNWHRTQHSASTVVAMTVFPPQRQPVNSQASEQSASQQGNDCAGPCDCFRAYHGAHTILSPLSSKAA